MYKSLENIHTINMYDINIFLTYSILGFFYECIINFIQDGRFSSGFMYGPWTPIYGIGVLIILYIYKKLKKYNKNISQDVKRFFKFLPKNDKQITRLVLKY